MLLHRRGLLKGGAATSAALFLAACSGSSNNSPNNNAASSGAKSSASSATAGSAVAAAGTPGKSGAVPISGGATPTPKSGGKVSFADGADPGTFDPPLSGYIAQYILSSTHNRLLGWKHGETVNQLDYTATTDEGLAASYEQPDAQTYTFALKPDVKFHNKPPINGRTLTAADVVDTFARLKAGGREVNITPQLDSVTAVDDTHVQFKLKAPYAPFLGLIGHTLFVITAQGIPDYSKPEGVIGTGPFILDQYQASVQTVMQRNPAYFKPGRPYIDTLTYKVIPDVNTIYAQTRAGDLDLPFFFWNGVPPSITDELLGSNKKLTKKPWDLTSPRFVTARMDKPPFNDVRVRRAVALSIDRQQWIDLVHEGKGRPSGTMPFMIEAPWYIEWKDLGDAGKYQKTDIQQAKQLMSAAGYANGFDTEYKPYTGLSAKLPEVDLVSQQLSKINIRAKPVYLDGSAFLQQVQRDKNYDGMLFWTHGFTSDFDPLMMPTYVTQNVMLIQDDNLTSLFNKQRQQLDTQARIQTAHDIQNYLGDQCYGTYEPIASQFMVYPSAIHNFGAHNSFDVGGMTEVLWRDDA